MTTALRLWLTLFARVANGGGVRALNTSSVRLCEKNNEVAASNQDDKTNADKEADPTESPAFLTQKVEDDSKVIKMAEQSEEPVVLKADDESAAQQQIDVKTEYVAAPPKQVRTGAGKSGKESLLELLGAMKVEVTNKKKLKTLKAQQSLESKPTSKPAAMESTISMFQQATAEASSQRWEGRGLKWLLKCKSLSFLLFHIIINEELTFVSAYWDEH